MAQIAMQMFAFQCLYAAFKEIYVRLNGKVFDGEIIKPGPAHKWFSRHTYEFFSVNIMYNGKRTTVKLDNRHTETRLYQRGDKVKIVCIPKKSKMAIAYRHGEYGALIANILTFVIFSLINVLILLFFWPWILS